MQVHIFSDLICFVNISPLYSDHYLWLNVFLVHLLPFHYHSLWVTYTYPFRFMMLFLTCFMDMMKLCTFQCTFFIHINTTEKWEQAGSRSHSSEKCMYKCINYLWIYGQWIWIKLRGDINHQPPPFRSCAQSLYYCSWQTQKPTPYHTPIFFQEAWY